MNVLMVCLGNICRSPIAQGILEKKMAKLGLKGKVDSAAIGDYHSGEAPDRRATLIASANGVDITKQKARQIRVSDYDAFDKIYVMDREIMEGMLALARNEEDRKKVDFLMNEVERGDRPVPDPYFGGDAGFKNVFDMIDQACEKIVSKMK